ncbi:MAG: DUF58 domain-containing protein [Ilumatobacteraceae bacterium]
MLTRHGWAALAAAAAAFAAGRVFALVDLFVLGAAIAAVLVVAIVGAVVPVPRLTTTREADPLLVEVDEPLRIELTVANRGRRTSPTLRLWEPVGDVGGATMQVAGLRPGTEVSAAYRAPTDRRGSLRLGPATVDRVDTFGLVRRRRELAGDDVVVVVPRRVVIDMPTPGRSGALAQQLGARALGRTGTDFRSQREYVPGDDPRRINWKATARVDELIVTEREAERLRRCTVVLDTNEVGHDGDSFDRAVSIAASISTASERAGLTTRLVAPGVDVSGHDVASSILHWLADVAPGDESVDPRQVSGGDDGLGLVVLVCATLDTARHILDATRIAPDDTVVVVHTAALGPDSAGASRPSAFTVAAPDLQTFADAWQSLSVGAQ